LCALLNMPSFLISQCIFAFLFIISVVSSNNVFAHHRPSPCVFWKNTDTQPMPTGTWSYDAVINPKCEEVSFPGVRGWAMVNNDPLLQGIQIPLTFACPPGISQPTAADGSQLPCYMKYIDASSPICQPKENANLVSPAIKACNATNHAEPYLYLRFWKAFENIRLELASYGATLADLTVIDVRTYDIAIMRPIANLVEQHIFGPNFGVLSFQVPYTPSAPSPFPPRGIFGDIGFNGLDCLTPTSPPTFYKGSSSTSPSTFGQVICNPGDKEQQ